MYVLYKKDNGELFIQRKNNAITDHCSCETKKTNENKRTKRISS